MELVLFGSLGVRDTQFTALILLLKKYSLPQMNHTPLRRVNWKVSDRQLDLSCDHREVDISLSGGSPAVQKFMVEAMSLTGVYTECPECTKCKRLEDEQRRVVSNTPDLAELINQRITEIRRGNPDYLSKGFRF